MNGPCLELAIELNKKLKKIEELEEAYDAGVDELFCHLKEVLDEVDCSGFPDWKYANMADIEFEHYGVSSFARKEYYEACAWLRQTKLVLLYDNERQVSLVERKRGATLQLSSCGWFGDEPDHASSDFPVRWLDWTAAEIQADIERKKAAADAEEVEAAKEIEKLKKIRTEAAEMELYKKLKAKYGE